MSQAACRENLTTFARRASIQSYPCLCRADTDSVLSVTDEVFGNDGSALQKDIDAFAGGKKKSAAPAKALSADDKADIAKFEAWVWLMAVLSCLVLKTKGGVLREPGWMVRLFQGLA